jgi:hypothetical protein
VAVVGVLAGGSVVAGEVAVQHAAQSDGAMQRAPAADRARSTTPPPLVESRPEAVRTSGTHGEQVSTERNHGQRGAERRTARSHRHGNAGSQARTHENSAGGRRLGQDKRASRTAAEPRGRGAPGGGQAKQPRVKPVTQSGPVPQRRPAPKAAVPAEPVAPTVEVPQAAPSPKATPPGQLKSGR